MKSLYHVLIFSALILSAGGFARKAPAVAPTPIPSSVWMNWPTHVGTTIDNGPPAPVASPSPAPSPIPAPSGVMIILRNTVGATDAEKAMIVQGIALANAMLKKNCFRQWVLAANYTENNDLTQAEILDLSQTKPSTVDVEFFTGSFKQNYVWKTIGYENDPYDGVVHMNRHFVNSAYMVGDNVIHEDRGHGLGFHHYGVKATSDPYGMNYAYEGCSNQMEQAPGGKPFKPPGPGHIEIHHARKKKTSK